MCKVKLISYSQSDGTQSIEDLIAYCARVSNPENQNTKAPSEGLIKYLIKHKHWSPFEMVNVCLEVETTRDIARQMLRHRSFNFQEFSQRYAISNDFTVRETRMQDEKNRQNSIECDDPALIEVWEAEQKRLLEDTISLYNWATSVGIAKEQARVILPEGLTMTKMYVNGNLRSWIHYIELRTGPETQKEHRFLAECCKQEIAKIFPLINTL